MDLCRLGVKKIFLLDFDVVDSHNLNRQALYGIEDIGKSKIKSATKNLESRENLQTEIIQMDMNALTNWSKIVTVAKESNVIFNMIDVGDIWDLAVQSLCLSLKIPHVSGGTFQNSMTVGNFMFFFITQIFSEDLVNHATTASVLFLIKK
jgi:molybdopterin-synthase adenylyltransferase